MKKPQAHKTTTTVETTSSAVPKSEPAAQPPQEATDWKKAFRVALDTVQKPEELNDFLHAGITGRHWHWFRDEEGDLFEDFDDFCKAQEPYGLGSSPEQVKKFLGDTLGKRKTARVTVSQPRRGRRTDKEEGGNKGSKGDKAKAAKEKSLLAAINNAPTFIRKLYDAEILSPNEAAFLGAKSPTEEKKTKIDKAVAQLKTLQKNELLAKRTPEVSKIMKTAMASDAPRPLLSVITGGEKELKKEVGRVYARAEREVVPSPDQPASKALSPVDLLVLDAEEKDDDDEVLLLTVPEQLLANHDVALVRCPSFRDDRGVMHSLREEIVRRFAAEGFDWVDEVTLIGKATAKERRTAATQTVSIQVTTPCLVFRRSVKVVTFSPTEEEVGTHPGDAEEAPEALKTGTNTPEETGVASAEKPTPTPAEQTPKKGVEDVEIMVSPEEIPLDDPKEVMAGVASNDDVTKANTMKKTMAEGPRPDPVETPARHLVA